MKATESRGTKIAMWVIGIACALEALGISAHWGYCMAKPDFWYCF